MSQSVIGALRVNLGLDSAQFERGARRTRDPLRAMRSQFMAVSAAAAAMGAALSLAVRSGLQDVDRVAKAAKTIDGTSAALRALELAAGDAGVSQADVTNAAQRMTREIARAAREGGRGADALGRLGLEAAALADMDADERLATIADRIRELGLSSGDTMDLLRDLGVRSEEMANLMTQGGGVIRAARREVDELGLALDEGAIRQIERTNDALSRIGLAFQAFRNRLAASVAPALESLANAFVDAMREGGALRRVLDGLADNIERLVVWTGTAVTAFGVRYVAALAAARVATATLSGALVVLRGALIRTGIGALIVGAGELVYQFSRLVRAAGGFGEAMQLLGNLAVAAWREIGQGGRGLLAIMEAVGWGIAKAFVDGFDWIARQWDRLINWMLTPFNTLMEAFNREFRLVAENPLGKVLGEASDSLNEFGITAAERAVDIFEGMEKTQAAIGALRDALDGLGDDADGVDDVADAADRLNQALSNIGDPGGGGGGSAGAATDGMDRFRDSITDTRSTMSEFENASRQAFVGFVAGADSARQAASRLLDSFARILANQAFTGLFGGLFGGGGASLGGSMRNIGGMAIPSLDFSAEGGGFTGHGPRSGGLDGRGGMLGLLHPNETVIDHTKGGGGQPMHITVQVDGASGDDHIVSLVQQGVRAGLGEYDRALPDRVRQVNNDPRGRR